MRAGDHSPRRVRLDSEGDCLRSALQRSHDTRVWVRVCVRETIRANEPSGRCATFLNKDLPRSFVLIPDDNCPELVAAGAQFSFVARLFGEAVSMHPYVPRRRGGLKRDRSRSQFAKRSGPIASRTTVLTPLNRSAYRSDRCRYILPNKHLISTRTNA